MKTMKKIVTTLLLVCVLASVLSVSAYAAEATIPVTGIALNKTSMSVKVGETINSITATVEPSNATYAANLYWESSDVNVISVTDDHSGVFKAEAVGRATLTAVIENGIGEGQNATASCYVTVTAADSSDSSSATEPTVTISYTTDTVATGSSIQLQANVTNGTFFGWKINELESGCTGSVTANSLSHPTITLTGGTTGKVEVSAYAQNGNIISSKSFYITVTEKRTLTLAADKTSLSYDSAFKSPGTGYTGIWVKNGGTEAFTWSYTYSPSTSAIVNSKTTILSDGTGVQLYADKGSGWVTVTATAKDGSGATGSITVYVNSSGYGDASVSPTSVTWTKGQGNLTFTVKPLLYTAYIDGVCITGSGNESKYSYTWSSKSLVINSSYLSTLSAGDHILQVDAVYEDKDTNGNYIKAGTVYATITINGTASAAYGDNAHVRGTSSALTFTASNPISSVYISNTLIDPANYTLSNNGKTVTLNPNFLNLLNYGTYTMTLNTTTSSNGTTATATETTTFRIVTANYAPATGDNSNLAIWLAVMIVSGVGAIALIPRRKKQH